MDRPLQLSVHHDDETYFAAVEPSERADQLLLRSLDYFGIDPEEKSGWRLTLEDQERPKHGLYLSHPIGDQVGDGEELRLQENVPGNRPPATGSY